MMKEILENVKKCSPQVHCITNYVTANDCANIVLACGGAPIMADDIHEVEDITSLCHGLYLNMGTLHPGKIASMRAAGFRANVLGHPVVLDPVGCGASKFRTEAAHEILDQVKVAVIRGNISEIKTLATGRGTTKGVEVDTADTVDEEHIEDAVSKAKEYAAKLETVVAITGAIDIVASADTAYVIHNGHPMMSRVTGAGCQLSALTAAYVAANPLNPLEAAVTAVCAMGVSGEIAHERMQPLDGNATYRNYVIDAVYNMDAPTLEKRARIKKM